MGNSITVLLIILVCFYYGILYGNEKILLVGFALLLLFLFSLAELVYRYLTLSAHMELPISIAEQKTPFSVGICIKNKGCIPTGRMRVWMGIKHTLEKKYTFDWMSISAVDCKKEAFDAKIVLQQAGYHEIVIKKIRIYSVTGLLFVNQSCQDGVSVLVMPKIHPIGVKLTEHTLHFLGDAEIYDTVRPGDDVTETFEIRAYQPKDKLQSIHWKLSAKMDELMVKENSLPKACAIVLMAETKQVKMTSVSAFFELFVSVSFSLMDADCPHFVAWYSKEQEDITRIRVADEESYYLFLNHYLADVDLAEKTNMRESYRTKYKNERYLHEICVNEDLELYCDGALLAKLEADTLEETCKELELVL